MPWQVHLQQCGQTERLFGAKCRRTAPRGEVLGGHSIANNHTRACKWGEEATAGPKAVGTSYRGRERTKTGKKKKVVNISSRMNIAPKLLEIDNSEYCTLIFQLFSIATFHRNPCEERTQRADDPDLRQDQPCLHHSQPLLTSHKQPKEPTASAQLSWEQGHCWSSFQGLRELGKLSTHTSASSPHTAFFISPGKFA